MAESYRYYKLFEGDVSLGKIYYRFNSETGERVTCHEEGRFILEDHPAKTQEEADMAKACIGVEESLDSMIESLNGLKF